MIKRIRHKGLMRFHESWDRSGIAATHAGRLNIILTVLEAAARPGQAALPGLRLHPLMGDRAGYWSVRVSGNWRVKFRFEDGKVTDVDYEDYH